MFSEQPKSGSYASIDKAADLAQEAASPGFVKRYFFLDIDIDVQHRFVFVAIGMGCCMWVIARVTFIVAHVRCIQ